MKVNKYEIFLKPKKTNQQRGPNPIEIILKKDRANFLKIEVASADKVIEGLDKVLKNSKIKITDINKITVDNFKKASYTSFRILKSIEKGLKFRP